MHKFVLFSFHLFFCLNLSHAQTTPATSSAPKAAATTQPSSSAIVPSLTPQPVLLPTPTPATTSTPTNPANTTAKAKPGKYQEYLSICRTNEYDHIFNLSDELKSKRIQLIQDKIKSGKETAKLKLRLLKEYIDQRKSTEVTAAYADVKKQKLSAIENDLAEGYWAYFQQKYIEAQASLEKVVLADANNIEAHKFLAEVYKEEKNYFEAAQIYQDLNKKLSGGFNEPLCEILILDSHHADGEIICKRAVLNKPTSPYPLIYLGISSREKENLAEARNYFQNSLKVKETEMGLTCLAELNTMESKYSASIENYKKSLQLNPKSIRALIGLGWAQLQNKNIDESLQTFKTLCGLDHKYITELRSAYKMLTTQNSPEAKKFIEQAQRCNE